MTLRLFNTLSGEKEEFQPLGPPKVKMYVCGITPYDETHLGHARAYVTFDMVRRHLTSSGYQVTYVQNITDIDDKIIKKSQQEQKPFSEIVKIYSNAYFEVMDKLNVQRADMYPKATEAIRDMVRVIRDLVRLGFAYQIGGDVYYQVSKFADYGKLSRRKLDDMKAGARVSINERKKDPMDFALWKAAKEGEPSWDSPWGKGRPGWHIECSTMSNKLLGETFDIHGGGRDLIFPHHENEIAQAEAFTGKPFVKYWMHNGFVNINSQKMSKSLGNFFTLRDIFKKFDPMVVRFFLLSTHYRSPINYSDKEIESAKEAWARINKFIKDVDFLIEKSLEKAPETEVEDTEEELLAFKDKFREAMDDDFNTAGAIAAIFELIHYCNKIIEGEQGVEKETMQVMRDTVVDLCDLIGLKIEGKVSGNEQIETLVAERTAAKQARDFKKADAIRDQLVKMNVTIEDTQYGTRWTKNA
ncbi:MAG: cysteine--tRNA ligase [Candidatus Saganbacteria bacterium]|nr:cysteine--tRNA ligase [Candidatus Saganbacteria bacterium]